MADDRKSLLNKLEEHIANFEERFHRPLTAEEKQLLDGVVRNVRKVLSEQDGILPSV